MRTPLKTLFFLILLTLTTTFFILGFSLWSSADENMRRLESTFITIGTVEQKPTSIETYKEWDAEKKDYLYSRHAITGKAIPISALDFPGANYICKPEMRPYYCAYDPKFTLLTDPLREAEIEEYTLIVEMKPLKDCETGDPVPVKITKLLMGFPTLQDTTILFCNHNEEKTYKLYANKTYIVGLRSRSAHEGSEYNDEYTPWGLSIPKLTGDSTVPWDEVTDNFYETPKGKAWLNYIKAEEESIRHTIPVIPTNYTKLIMAFYNGDARITEGCDISADEYKNGERVCLVQQGFAQKNGLKVGDSLSLPLIWTSYSSSGYNFDPNGESGTSGRLNENGEFYTPFDNKTYKIAGIYNVAASDSLTLYTLGGNAVIVPFKSVANDNSSGNTHITPMRGDSTSFRIPNGTIEKFMKAWKAQGIDDLDITFYDKGYSKIKAGLDEMKNMAILMFSVGAVTTLFVIILFCHLFITKQRRRTAIERSLGLSKALCTLSLLIGVLVIVIPASVFGGFLSHYIASYAVPKINQSQSVQEFDTTYSDWVNSADNEPDSAGISIDVGGIENYLAGLAIIPLSLLIAWAAIRGNLKEEPLKLLSEKER